jgi:hypothetical protein
LAAENPATQPYIALVYGKVLCSEYPPAGLLGLGPSQVFIEEVEGAHAVDGMPVVEELDGGLVADA